MRTRQPSGLPPWALRGTGLATGLLLVGLWLTTLPVVRTDARGPMIALTALLVVLALFWRRRAPMLTFGLSVVAAGFQWALVGPLFVDLAVLLGFYTVAATSSRRRTAAAAVVLEFGVVVAAAAYGRGGTYPLVGVLLTGLVVAAGVLGLNVKVRAAYLAEVEARAARLEVERDQQGRLAVAAERTRIAREMHDIVAHNLSVMIALNDGASFTMVSDPQQAAEAVREASSVGRTALSEMQRALGVLRDQPGPIGGAPELLPAPSIADLDRLLAPIRRTGLHVTLTAAGAAPVITPGLQLTIYRLVQESLTNAVKHARGVSRVDVSLRYEQAGVEVRVLDDGNDSSGPAAEMGSGQGLIGMRERAAGHGGQVQTGPTSHGWLVLAWFPFEAVTAGLAPLPVGANV